MKPLSQKQRSIQAESEFLHAVNVWSHRRAEANFTNGYRVCHGDGPRHEELYQREQAQWRTVDEAAETMRSALVKFKRAVSAAARAKP